jgi:hypothetical protein
VCTEHDHGVQELGQCEIPQNVVRRLQTRFVAYAPSSLFQSMHLFQAVRYGSDFGFAHHINLQIGRKEDRAPYPNGTHQAIFLYPHPYSYTGSPKRQHVNTLEYNNHNCPQHSSAPKPIPTLLILSTQPPLGPNPCTQTLQCSFP